MSSRKSISRPDLSIVVPAYREAKRIGDSLDELARFLRQDQKLKGLAVEVIVVSADSPDSTHQLVEKKLAKFQNATLLKPGPKVGKGRDVQYGMLRANGAAVIFMDADLATPLRHIAAFYADIQKGVDVVIATRNLRKHHASLIRRAVSNLGNILFRVAGGVWVEDSQCGFKMFSAEAAKICFSRLSIAGWGFDMEVLAIAKANGLKLKSRRINDWKSVPNGTFTEGMLKNSTNSLIELARIFGNRLTGSYKAPRKYSRTK